MSTILRNWKTHPCISKLFALYIRLHLHYIIVIIENINVQSTSENRYWRGSHLKTHISVSAAFRDTLTLVVRAAQEGWTNVYEWNFQFQPSSPSAYNQTSDILLPGHCCSNYAVNRLYASTRILSWKRLCTASP